LWFRRAGTKKGREFDPATASQQRRYKSNKRKYSIQDKTVNLQEESSKLLLRA